MPSRDTISQQLSVVAVRNRKILSDAQLDKLISYFLQKKEAFEKAITEENQLKSNGEILYKIDSKDLP